MTGKALQYKLIVGEGQTHRVFTGEASYILGIVNYLKAKEHREFEILEVTEKVITFRTLKNRAQQ